MEKKDLTAKMMLLSIGIMNSLFILLQDGGLAIIGHLCLSILLFRGNIIVKWLFTISATIGIIFSLFIFKEGNYIYSICLMSACLFTVYSLTLNKNIKKYIEKIQNEKVYSRNINYIQLGIGIMFFCLFSFSSVNTYRRSGLLNIDRVIYDSNIEQLNLVFPFFYEVENCYYKIGLNKSYSLGDRLNTISLNGYIVLTDKSSELLLNEYEWSSDNIKIDNMGNPYNIENLLHIPNSTYVNANRKGWENIHWLYNEQFSDLYNSDKYDGELFFDENNKIVYFIGTYRKN